MQKKTLVITFSLVLILLVGTASAFSFSDWFKDSFFGAITGNAIESGTYGEYALASPLTALASDAASGSAANNAIDGDTETQWLGNDSAPYPKWIYFDLGSEKCVNSLDLYFATASVSTVLDIQISNDAETWTTLTQDLEILVGDAYSTSNVEESTARYVRIHQTAGPENVFGSLSEIKVSSADYTPAESSEEETTETTEVVTCSETDAGLDVETPGSLDIMIDGVKTSYSDTCSSQNTLTEYSCSDLDALETTTVHCPNGCDETGAC